MSRARTGRLAAASAASMSSLASVSEDGIIRAVGSGWATIAVESEVEGGTLTTRVRAYVLQNHVVPAVKSSSPHSTEGLGNPGWMNRPECLVGSGGTESPDITASDRGNGYRVGLYHMDANGNNLRLIVGSGSGGNLEVAVAHFFV